MKLLIVISRPFWPITGGHEYMLFNYCEKLHLSFGVNIEVVCFGTSKNHEVPDFISKVYYLKKRNLLSFSFGFIKYLLSDKMSLQSILFFRKKSAIQLKEIIENTKPDSVLIDLVRMQKYAEYVPSGVKMNLYAEDLFSTRYERMLERKQYKNALGQMGNNAFFKVLSKIPFLLKVILKRESKTIKLEEQRSVTYFSKIIFVSDKEATTFNEDNKTDKGTVVTMGFDISKYNFLNYEHQSNKIAIIGNFTVAANKDSLIYIIEKILPRFSFNFTFNVYGKINIGDFKKYKNESINFHGFVENSDELLCQNDIFLSPILYGTGIKTKILQALSLGIPVVTNGVGFEGLGEEARSCVAVSEDIDEIVLIVQSILNDKDKQKRISTSAIQYVKKNHDWKTIISKLNGIL